MILRLMLVSLSKCLSRWILNVSWIRLAACSALYPLLILAYRMPSAAPVIVAIAGVAS